MIEEKTKIICGVDVTGCTNLINERCVFNYSLRIKDMPLCKDEPNCVFKQKQREIQRKDEKIKKSIECLEQHCKDCPCNYDCKHHNLDDKDCPCFDILQILKGEENV